MLHANAAARQQGVQQGMSVAAARALVADIQHCPRDHVAEMQTLQRLAAWAGQYTSMVSVQMPHALLLEIGGSLQLFGGMRRLWSKLAQDMGELGFESLLAVAPTPTAAYWLAYAQQSVIITARAEIMHVLGRLPVAQLPWAPVVLDKLQAVGLRYMRDVWRLPREGLARRFGVDLLTQMDQALGHSADPRSAYVAPATFSAAITLPAPTTDSAALVFAAQRLLLELAGFLRARGAGVQYFELSCSAGRSAATKITIGTAHAHRHVEQWRILVREHLEKLQISAPVDGLQLRAPQIETVADRSGDMFDAQNAGVSTLWLERVRARLGNDVINGVCAVAEHRPEYAWHTTPPDLSVNKNQTQHHHALPDRPLWLLAQPLAIRAERGRLWYGGVLHKVRGPERIESGWWDQRPMTRDYYVVENVAGIRYWVFRDNAEGRWFLHGVFW